MCHTFNGDLAFCHRFQQCALGFGGGAVNFIGKHQFRKNRARMEFKFFLITLVNGNTENIGWQKITGELDALVTYANDVSQRVCQGGLADTG